MKLLAGIAAYVKLKQSLGAVFAADRRILQSFGHHLGDLAMDALTPDACRGFCLGTGALTRFAERKHQTLRGFFTYAAVRCRDAHLPRATESNEKQADSKRRPPYRARASPHRLCLRSPGVAFRAPHGERVFCPGRSSQEKRRPTRLNSPRCVPKYVVECESAPAVAGKPPLGHSFWVKPR
jgi:hypothetical protein